MVSARKKLPENLRNLTKNCYPNDHISQLTINNELPLSLHPQSRWHISDTTQQTITKARISVDSHYQVSKERIYRIHTHTRPFNGPLSGTTQVSRYQKGKTNLDFTGARDSEWQWHQLGHMQICSSLQTDNHASTSLLGFYRPDALPAAQPTASKHWRHSNNCTKN